MNSQSRWFHRYLLLLSIGFLLLSACTPATQAEVPTPPDDPATEIPPEATATEALAAAPSVLLVISPQANPFQVSQTQLTLEALAAESGLALEATDNLTSDAIHAGVKIVVSVGPISDLSAIASTRPDVMFVIISNPDAAPAANVAIVGDPLADEQQQSFAAGYLAALISTDYKVAGLFPSDQSYTTEAVNAYVIGARFFCGLCNPKFPPYSRFPKWEVIPPGALEGAQPILAEWVSQGVEVVYLHPSLGQADLGTEIAANGFILVGGSGNSVSSSNRAATVSLDPSAPLRELWEDLLMGIGGQKLPLIVTLTDINPTLLSEGRLKVFEDIMSDFDEGLILPEFTP